MAATRLADEEKSSIRAPGLHLSSGARRPHGHRRAPVIERGFAFLAPREQPAPPILPGRWWRTATSSALDQPLLVILPDNGLAEQPIGPSGTLKGRTRVLLAAVAWPDTKPSLVTAISS